MKSLICCMLRAARLWSWRHIFHAFLPNALCLWCIQHCAPASVWWLLSSALCSGRLRTTSFLFSAVFPAWFRRWALFCPLVLILHHQKANIDACTLHSMETVALSCWNHITGRVWHKNDKLVLCLLSCVSEWFADEWSWRDSIKYDFKSVWWSN